MQQATDWLDLWRELAELQAARWKGPNVTPVGEDVWRDRARGYDARVKQRWATPDSSREWVVAQLRAHPDWTALDIGGGTGNWAALLAQSARRVTVVEPSPAMREVLRENVAAAGASNVTVVEAKWPEASVAAHDLTLCAHAMYALRDFAAFVRSIEAVTRRVCVLMMRAPIPEGLMARAARRVWGQPYDSPDFQVGYNALLQMGRFPNVLMEDSGLWEPWSNASLEEAFAELKRKLGLPDPSAHDAFLWELVVDNLTYVDGKYLWPRGIRSALVYWPMGPVAREGVADARRQDG